MDLFAVSARSNHQGRICGVRKKSKITREERNDRNLIRTALAFILDFEKKSRETRTIKKEVNTESSKNRQQSSERSAVRLVGRKGTIVINIEEAAGDFTLKFMDWSRGSSRKFLPICTKQNLPAALRS